MSTETYGFGITDARTGERLGDGVGFTSPYTAALAANRDIAHLLGSGHAPDVLFLADDGERSRRLDPMEQASVVSALEQTIAQLAEETTS